MRVLKPFRLTRSIVILSNSDGVSQGRIPPAPRRLRSTATRWHGIIPALYVLSALYVLWPLVAHLRSGVATTEGDPLLNAWTLRWVQHTLFTHPTHLYDGNMFAPNPHTLAFSELLLPQAIMAWPIWLIAHDGLLAYNLMVLVTYPLCAIAMYALCRALGAARGAALIAGFCYAYAPFRLDNDAHLQVLSMQWMPLAILTVIRFMQRPSWLRGVAVVVTVILVGLSSAYYAVIFGTGFAALLLVEGVRRRAFFTRAGAGLLLTLGLAAAVVVLADIPYLTMRDEQGIVRTLDEAYEYAAHRASYVTTVPGSILWRHVLPTAGIGPSALFPGALLTLFALLGLWRLRRPWMAGLLALGIVGFVVSFGPTWGAKDAGRPLPYRLLYQHVVFFQGLRGPDRFATLVLLAMAVFAAVGMTAIWDSLARTRPWIHSHAIVATLLIAGLAIADTAAQMPPIVPVDRSPETLAPYRWLAEQPDTGIIAEFPVGRYEQRTAFYSTYHWHDVLWGHSGFVPAATYQLRGVFTGSHDFPAPRDLGMLADMGVRTLVVHRSAYDAGTLADLEDQLRHSPDRAVFRARVGESDLYSLNPPAPLAPFTVQVAYGLSPLGNVDRLPGQLIVINHDTQPRMFYTVGQPRVTAEIRDATGSRVTRQGVTIVLPAIIAPGTTAIPFSIKLPPQPGNYALSLTTTRLPSVPDPAPTHLQVVSLTALPHLSLKGLRVTSPPLYTAGEPVAMWVTTKDGTTFPLSDTMAHDDRTIDVLLTRIPADAAQIVAHGKWSGVELWVAPP